MNPVRIIRFGCSIRYSDGGEFLYPEALQHDPEGYIEGFIRLALKQVSIGKAPLVKVKYWPNKAEHFANVPPEPIGVMRKAMNEQNAAEAKRDYTKQFRFNWQSYLENFADSPEDCYIRKFGLADLERMERLFTKENYDRL